jgi:hypothetical protein
MAISNINSLSLDPSGGFPASATATVATSQTTTSTSYTDLATAGPAVTVTTGTKALVSISAAFVNSTTNQAWFSFAVSGATTVAASDTFGALLTSTGYFAFSRTFMLTGLSPGSNTFTMKYRDAAVGTATFENRNIIVIDMGS